VRPPKAQLVAREIVWAAVAFQPEVAKKMYFDLPIRCGRDKFPAPGKLSGDQGLEAPVARRHQVPDIYRFLER
jgi:hypothetical protein